MQIYWIFPKGGGGKQCTVSHILVKEEAQCEGLKQQLAGGKADFAALAKAHSTCPSGKSGGSLGKCSPGMMVPQFDKVMWTAPIGEVQGPIETQFGFHLVLVHERTEPEKSN